MVNENNSSLFEIYQNFFDEAEVLENEIKENEFSISETEDYLDCQTAHCGRCKPHNNFGVSPLRLCRIGTCRRLSAG